MIMLGSCNSAIFSMLLLLRSDSTKTKTSWQPLRSQQLMICSISHKAMSPKVKKEKGKEKAATPKAKAAGKNKEEVKAEEPATKKNEAEPSDSSKEKLALPREKVSGLIISLKHQTRAKRASEERKKRAQEILDDSQLHGVLVLFLLFFLRNPGVPTEWHNWEECNPLEAA